ncbi:dnaJ homolog subfamily C member 4 [Myxocyprinus asiaticus]|uniref:dnaJ homolog subfamily C member 4 n=1 Tax=Myxocyprinus asiaticus TaxID=70543 RepID=UPI002221FEF6|nr:dnaJ homolog subfamily C member 4 [Myxocyprinus asiaticus]XP_051505753.1 dnaJ homolog subfamily C member 4 [Myxocyprinus asiaticus]XP_051505755.1 dnaJ homolog subfamily C member 4 [Myxocyprinus asiaticus]XP_051505756.1 dnaJ homolog subfamily C member 4 [Myxocyprinus asiaticus]
MQFEAQLRLCQSCLWCCKSFQRLISLSTAHRSSANYYDLLGVKPDATLDQIKNAFFDKSKKLHPDIDPSNPGLHSKFVQLNEAYRVLSREGSRRDYDLKLRYQFAGDQAFRTSSSSTYSTSAEAAERMRYWEQFRQAQPQDNTAEEWEKRKKRNMRLVGYCVLTMLISLSAHYFGFRKLEEVHNNFMDEKDRIINEIYNESKERARVNGFKKQQEILRQKHADFLERYKIRNNGEEK